jgi:colicin import membrane protein
VVFQRQQPGQWKAGALALLVHVLFLGLMIFSVSWQNQEPSGIQVELWSEVPAPAKVAAPAPPRKPEPKPEPNPKPEPKPEPKPAPPEPKPEPKQLKADIELKAKEEEKKKRHEEELKQQKEKQKQEEEKRKQKLEEEKRKQELDRKLQQEKQEALRQQQAQIEAENARKAEAVAAGQRVLDDYRGRIQAKIKRFVILPPDMVGNPQAEFDVTLMPTGEVLHLKLTRSSGSGAYDNAVERAIYKAQPLPLPPDPGQFSKFRELHLKFKPREDL